MTTPSTTANQAASVIPAGTRFAPIPPQLLALDGLQLTHLRVWSHVWQETLGRPQWTLSYGQVAKGAGVGRATAVRAVAWLVNHGWMSREARTSASGDADANLLRCLFPAGVVTQLTPPSDLDETTGGDLDDTRGGDLDEPHQESHHQKNHHRESQPAAAAAADHDLHRPDPADSVDCSEWLEHADPTGWQRAWDIAAAALTTEDRDAYCDPGTPSGTWDRIHERLCQLLLDAYDRAQAVAA